MLTKIYQPDEFDKQALDLLQTEVNAWANPTVQVSDDASFSMRDTIDKSRKNYYGIFETPKDADTDLKKLWTPLTEWTVETIVKNIDLDTKDVLIKSPQAKKSQVAQLVRLITFHFLKLMGFGEFLNDFIRRMTIDGTAVAKCVQKWSKEYKRNLPFLRIIDPLNILIDPSAHSLHEVPLIERAMMTKDEVARKDWKNKEYIDWSEGSVPKAITYERWGLMPKSFDTKNEADKDTWIKGTIIASANTEGLFEKASPTSKGRTTTTRVLHKIIVDKDNFKPYEECWYKRVPNRWHGRSPGEMIDGLQSWLNTVINIRRDELMNKLAGKYKYRKGTGITRQMLESIKAGGAIPVDQMNDIMQLNEGDIKGSAYQEPREIISMADRVTGAFEMARGEALPPSTPATTAVLQERGSRSSFALTQENIGMFLERLFKRHIIPLVIKSLKQGEIMRITGEREDLEILDEMFLRDKFNKKFLDKAFISPMSEQVELVLMDTLRNDLKKLGKDRDIEILKTVFDEDYDVDVEITSEKFDKAILVRNLIDLIQARLPGMDGEALGREVAEIMGLSGSRFTSNIKAEQEQQLPSQSTTRREVPTPRTEFQRASLEGTLSPREK